MRRSVHVVAAALAVAGLAPASLAQTANTAPPANLSDEAFVKEAAQIDSFEIAASQAAEGKNIESPYKAYARTIIADQQSLDNGLRSTLAGLHEAAPPQGPPALDERRAGTLKALQSAAGRQFEQQYRSSQFQEQREAIELFHNYARSGHNQGLKQWAAAALPVLQNHLGAAEKLPQVTIKTP